MPVVGGGSLPEVSFNHLWNLFDCRWYAVVGEWLILSRLHRAAHKADINWAPL
jgi:hypothetical protein